MADPILSSGLYGNVFLYYTCDRDPTNSEPLVYNDISYLSMFWWNTITNDFFRCVDNTASAMEWVKEVDSSNIEGILSAIGITSHIARNRIQRNSPEFNTSYQPSSTRDVEVNLTLNVTSLLSFSSTVNIQTSPDNLSWTTIFNFTKALLTGANENYLITFTVPVGSYYRIVQAAGTVSSIVSIYELTL